MPFRNTAETYGSFSKFLHWAIVLLIVGQWLLAETAEDAGKGTPERASLMGWHISFGMLVLLLALVRLGWKLANKGKPDGVGVAWQRSAASMGHALLYLLILAQPITGWIVSSSANSPVTLFGWFQFPAIVGHDRPLHETMEDVHKFLFYTLLAVVAAHIAAALFHHLVLKDGVLRRMLPFAKPSA